VQFSGEASGKIESGRDPKTGQPKGLAVITRHPPIEKPIETGPTFAMTFWGLRDFASVGPGDEPDAYWFTERDLYLKDERTPRIMQTAYVLEGHVLPRTRMGNVVVRGPRQHDVSIYHPYYQRRGGWLDLRFIDLPGQPAFLGIMISRLTPTFERVPSGYVLTSPSDMEHALAAAYPEPFSDPPEKSLSRDNVAVSPKNENNSGPG
jgi:hypothetical protein